MQSPYTLKKQNLFYQPEADDSFHIFLKKEPYLLEVPHYHESLEFAYIEREETVARIGDKKRLLTTGDICFADKLQIHSYEYYKKNLSAIVIVLGKEYTVNFTKKYENMTFPSFMTDKEKKSTRRKDFKRLAENRRKNIPHKLRLYEFISRRAFESLSAFGKGIVRSERKSHRFYRLYKRKLRRSDKSAIDGEKLRVFGRKMQPPVQRMRGSVF